MTNLEERIKNYAQKYYEGNPEISDYEFDNLVEELRKENPDSEILKLTGWGYDPMKSLIGEKVRHKYGLITGISRKPRSVDNIPEEFYYGPNRVSAKLDGLSGVAYFKNGKFILGLTRGNGEIGINRTDKFRAIFNRSSKINNIPNDFNGAIRGEFVISNENWNKIKNEYEDYKSQRNLASGILNRTSIDEDIKYLDFVVYKIIAEEDSQYWINSIGNLKLWFDNVVEYEEYSPSECNVTHEYLEDKYSQFKKTYPCDGCVITRVNLHKNKETNEIVHDEIAYKFDTEVAESEVIDVTWNLTRTKKLKPLVWINPVDLSGATIRKATGFNAQYILKNKIGTGSVISVMRSGDVIPDIQEVLVESNDPAIPTKCPVCNSDLEWIGVDVCCTNEKCSGGDLADLHHWTSWLGDVDGLGYKIKDEFFKSNNIETIEDFYAEKHLLVMESITGQKLCKMIDKLKHLDVDPIYALCALNIPRLGWRSSSNLIEDGLLDVLYNYENYSKKEFVSSIINSVGVATSESIWNNRNKLSRLDFVYDRIKELEVEDKSEIKGRVVITGKLNYGTRKNFEELLKDNGYELQSGINKDTDFLITNTPNSGSSKNKKADSLGIKKITEKEFIEGILNKEIQCD